MTHAALVDRGAAWLRGTHGCVVVLTEHTGVGTEQPDVIGWDRVGNTILVECKRSRSDFYADAQKPWRDRRRFPHPHGQRRWFLLDRAAFPTMPQKVPDGWGVAYVTGRRVLVARPAIVDPAWTREHDLGFLLSELRRFQVQGMKPLTWAEHQDVINPPWGDVEEARALMGPSLGPLR